MIRELLATALVLGLAGSASAGTLTVTGSGEASAIPDMATMSLGVRHSKRTAAEAMDQVAKDSNAMLAALRAEGLGDKDLQTGQISLYPNWDYDQQRVTGFSAASSIMVTLRDLDRIGEVLSMVAEIGGNNFGGFSLGLSDPSELEAQARVLAVEDALMKARQYAEAAGVQLGDILSIQEGGGGGGGVYPVMAMAEAKSVASIEVAAGETSVSQTVTLEIEFH